jgi:hypothetical protein
MKAKEKPLLTKKQKKNRYEWAKSKLLKLFKLFKLFSVTNPIRCLCGEFSETSYQVKR